jgi:hypothetical protein
LNAGSSGFTHFLLHQILGRGHLSVSLKLLNLRLPECLQGCSQV